MQEREVAVTVEPLGKSVHVLQYTRLVEALAEAGVTIDQPCGGEGSCGKCRVRMKSGACEATLVDVECFSAEEIRQGWRLACQAVIEEPAVDEKAPPTVRSALKSIEPWTAKNPVVVQSASTVTLVAVTVRSSIPPQVPEQEQPGPTVPAGPIEQPSPEIVPAASARAPRNRKTAARRAANAKRRMSPLPTFHSATSSGATPRDPSSSERDTGSGRR